MDDNFNTIAGWALFSGICALGLTIVTGEHFAAERPEKMGYPIEGVVEGGEGGTAANEPAIETLMAAADPAKGAEVFKKCAACHSVTQGGANGVGPNLYGVVGGAHGHVASFAYSDVLKAKPGKWDFAALNEWLKSPRGYAPGTKMTFAGLGKPEDRANVIKYLNEQGSNLPMPAAPAAGAEAAVPAASPEAAASDTAAPAAPAAAK
jgi:cytochrome c